MPETKTFTAIPVAEFLRQVNEGVLDDDQPVVFVEDLLIWWGVRQRTRQLDLISPDSGYYDRGKFYVGDDSMEVDPSQVTAVMRCDLWEGFR